MTASAASCSGPASERPVGLSDLAEFWGLTEQEYARRLLSCVGKGRLVDAMEIRAQADFCDWVSDRGLLDGAPFLVSFRLSQNRRRDVCLWCACEVDMGGDEPLVKVTRSEPGVVGSVPRFMEGLPAYDVPLTDLGPIEEEVP
jgi:hypothetical protein